MNHERIFRKKREMGQISPCWSRIFYEKSATQLSVFVEILIKLNHQIGNCWAPSEAVGDITIPVLSQFDLANPRLVFLTAPFVYFVVSWYLPTRRPKRRVVGGGRGGGLDPRDFLVSEISYFSTTVCVSHSARPFSHSLYVYIYINPFQWRFQEQKRQGWWQHQERRFFHTCGGHILGYYYCCCSCFWWCGVG